MSCYAFRVSQTYAHQLCEELEIGRLRQGWGYNENLNLRKDSAKKDRKAKRNFSIKDKVKKGDYLVVAYMPDKSQVSIAQATKDFSSGYVYDEKSLECHDFGHIFPAKLIAVVPRKALSANLRNSFRCRLRFFTLQKHENEIRSLANSFNTRIS